METAMLIEEQIVSCKELLKVFTDERESYGDCDTVDLNIVMQLLKRKQDILGSFTRQKEIITAINSNGHTNEEAEKKLLRELGGILEQLLVIDQENEVLLRKMISKKPGQSSEREKKSSTAFTPSMPFCPNPKKEQFKEAVPSTLSTAVTIEQSDRLQEKLNLFSRKKLRAYGA
jgi:hypothetical protein